MLSYLANRLGIEVDELWKGTLFWTNTLAHELATGSEEAREVLERSLTLLEEEGEVSTRALELAHTELARATRDSMKAEGHLRAALNLHESAMGLLSRRRASWLCWETSSVTGISKRRQSVTAWLQTSS